MNVFWIGFRDVFECFFGWCGFPQTRKGCYYDMSGAFMWGGVFASVVMATTLVMGTILLWVQYELN